MMSQEQNDELTRVGPGSGAGNVLRHYWQPAALSAELGGERPVTPVRLLGRIWCCSATRQVSSG